MIYRPVPGFLDLYAGIDGTIITGRRGIKLKQTPTHNGYLRVSTRTGPRFVHRLVAAAFLGPRLEDMQVRHGDGDRTNNNLMNLCYGTPADNAQDSVAMGTHIGCIMRAKTECPQGHPYTPENTYIAPRTGFRQCRICRAVYAKTAETKRDRAAQMRAKRAELRRK